MGNDAATTVAETDESDINRPVRGADRNHQVGEQADFEDEPQVLPSLDPGITLLDVEGDRGVPVIHSLVLDELLVSEGPAFWVDANGYATTASLARLAPSMRLLDRIHVTRGFTAYQHYGAVSGLPDAVARSIRTATAPDREPEPEHGSEAEGTPSMFVAPAVDAPYRTSDTLGETDAETLLSRSLAQFSALADAYDVPVLLTRTTGDTRTGPVVRAADQHLTCEYTRMGPRFVGDDFETLVYPVDGDRCYQTTFAYWQQLLGTRAVRVGVDPGSPTQSAAPGSASVGTGSTGTDDRTPATTDPVRDAWSDAGGPAASTGEQ